MELRDQVFENDWVRLAPLQPSPETREIIRSSGAVEAMWDWMPHLSGPGTKFDAYYESVVRKMKQGRVLPLWSYNKSGGVFSGGAMFTQISRTHRSAQIDYLWTMPDARGSYSALATQAAMIQGAIDWRAKRVYWLVDTLNTPLVKFIEEKVGARKEGEMESYARMNDGRWSNMAIYALVGNRLGEAVARIEATLKKDFPETD